MQFIYNDPNLKENRRRLRKDQTDAEKMLWFRLRNRQFYGIKFYRQYSIGSYILDFYCAKYKFAIELDGGQHAEKENQEYDSIRADYLRKQGINILRFWNIDIFQNIEGVLQKISEYITPLTPPDLPLS